MQTTIKVERARLDMTQAQLASQVGLSRQAINAIEKGKSIPSVETAIKISRVFDVQVETLFRLESEDNKPKSQTNAT